jgi:hypothetical protein
VPLRRLRLPVRRPLRLALGGVLLAIAIIQGGSLLAAEPLRRSIQARVNASLQGYTVVIEDLDLHPFSLGLTFQGLSVMQDANPDPPVARFAQIGASLQWSQLLRGAIVADARLERPEIHVDLRQVRGEDRDAVPVQQRGWQDAVSELYPLDFNQVRIVGGSFTYVDTGPFEPLRITDIDARARNVRNVRSSDHTYPSELELQCTAFGKGRISVEGHADFLATPHPGISAHVQASDVDLAYFRPIAERYNLRIRSARLSLDGDVEYAPRVRDVRLAEVALHGVEADYVHGAQTAGNEAQRADRAADVASKGASEPAAELHLQAERVRVDGEIGFVNEAAEPAYRAYLDGATLRLDGFDNRSRSGIARARLAGRLMGSGSAEATAEFRPEQEGPDFNLTTRVEQADLRSLNELLRAHGGFDVVGGQLSVYSEFSVQHRFVRGYVKPLFQDLDVYGASQESGKGVLRKAYEAAVGGLGSVLRNSERDEVATQIDLSGPVDDPQASTWQVIVGLVQNAFFEAILPGFEGRGARRG